MDTTEIVILAAGKGTRMGSDCPKCLVPVKGIPMIDRLLTNIENSLRNKALIVVGHKAEVLQEYLGDTVRYVTQTELKGTALSAKIALTKILPSTKNIVVIYSDHPFVTSKTIEKIIKNLEKNPVVMATVNAGDFTDWKSLFTHWGRIIKNENGEVDRIVEYKDADENTRRISTVNPGFYGFNVKLLKLALEQVKPNNAQGEYYLTDVIKIVREMGKTIGEVDIDPKESIGINSKAELEYVEGLI